MVLLEFTGGKIPRKSITGLKKLVTEKKPFVLLIYWNACGHCKRLMDPNDGNWENVRDKYKAKYHIVEIEESSLKHMLDHHMDLDFIQEIYEHWPKYYPAIMVFNKKQNKKTQTSNVEIYNRNQNKEVDGKYLFE